MKYEISADFQICISVPLNLRWSSARKIKTEQKSVQANGFQFTFLHRKSKHFKKQYQPYLTTDTGKKGPWD